MCLFPSRPCLQSPAIASLTFEKACVLFNMAALQSQVASSLNLENDDSLKLAAKLFQVRFCFSLTFSIGALFHTGFIRFVKMSIVSGRITLIFKIERLNEESLVQKKNH